MEIINNNNNKNDKNCRFIRLTECKKSFESKILQMTILLSILLY